MKIRRLLVTLLTAGLSFSQAVGQEAPHFGSSASRHIGDSGVEAADSPMEVEEAIYGGEDYSGDSLTKNGGLETSASLASHHLDMSTIAPTASRRMNRTRTAAPSNNWLSFETLLWFGDDRNSPALATTSAQGVEPVAGATGVTTAFGGNNGIETGLLPGYRLSGGKYLGEGQCFGVGGRVYGIYSGQSNYNATSDGSTSLGIPFYNVALTSPANDAYLVGFTNALNQPVSEGAIDIRSDLDMVGADSSLYILLGKSDDHRFDMLAGYTFNKLKNSVGVASNSTNLFTGDLIPDGTVFTTDDMFSTDNTFHGAHLGVLSSIVRNKVSVETLARVSFGNMRQISNVSGVSTETFGGITTTTPDAGIFAQQSNIGSNTRDTFAFIPEFGLKFNYAASDCLQLSVGYTFMFWSSVALAGEQMDSTVDLTQVIGPAGNRPAFDPVDGSYWMQGIDLGLSLVY